MLVGIVGGIMLGFVIAVAVQVVTARLWPLLREDLSLRLTLNLAISWAITLLLVLVAGDCR